MKIGLISDIHANLQALEACLRALDQAGVDLVACLGDIVGYGADPNACLDLVRQRAAHTVLGNHDAAVVDKTAADYFNGDARTAVEWTRAQLSADNRRFLEELPYIRGLEGDVLLSHSGAAAPPAWNYVFNRVDAEREFTAFVQRTCFIGHTHFPAIFVSGSGGVVHLPPPAYRLAPGERLLVNVGSVGQPRDGDARAACGIFDVEAGTVEVRRVAYDLEQVQERILATALPRSAAERLAWGV